MALPPKPAGVFPATQIRETSGPTSLTLGAVADGEFLVRDGETIIGSAGGGGGAPTTSQYVTLATDAGLSNERVLTAGDGIKLTDGGAGGNLTVQAGGVVGAPVVGGGGLTRWFEAGRVNATAGSTASFSNNLLRAIPFRAPSRGGTIDQLAFNVTTLIAGNARIGAYRSTSKSNLYPSTRIADSGDISTGAAGVKTYATSITLEPGELIWIVLVNSAATSMRSVPVGGLEAVYGVDATMPTTPGVGVSVAHAYAALPATFTAGGAALVVAVPALAVRMSA